MAVKDLIRKYYIIITLILIGFFFRVYFLGFQSFWMDESFTINAAQGILKHGYPLMDSGIVYNAYFLNTYLIALFIKIFGLSEFSTRFVSVIFGTLMIPLMYFFGKEFGDKRIGWIAAFLTAFSAWEIAWSRQARMYMQLQFFYMLSLLFFYRFLNDKSRKNLYLLIVFTLFTFLSHVFGYILLAVYSAYLAIFYFKEIAHPKSLLIECKKYITKKNIVLLLIPALFLAYYLPGVITRILSTEVTEKMDYLGRYLSYLQDAHSIVFYFAVIGVILALTDFKRISLLVLAYAIPFYFIGNHVLLIHYRYLFFLLPILFFFSSYSFLYMVDLSGHIKFRKTASVLIALILIFFMFNSNALVYSPQKEFTLELETPQPDFRGGFGYVKDSIRKNEIVITPHTVMARIYMVEPNYSIDYNPSGVYLGSNLVINSSYDVYTNTTAILNLTAFNKVINNKKGYVVVDKFSLRRMDKGIANGIRNLTLVKNIDKDIYSGIQVYKFQ